MSQHYLIDNIHLHIYVKSINIYIYIYISHYLTGKWTGISHLYPGSVATLPRSNTSQRGEGGVS